MTDTSSKGLFPQLTDVLYALTESHAVLLAKVRGLRLEHSGQAQSWVNVTEDDLRVPLGSSFDAHTPATADGETSLMLFAQSPKIIDRSESAPPDRHTVSSELDSMTDTGSQLDVEIHGADRDATASRQPIAAGKTSALQTTVAESAPTSHETPGIHQSVQSESVDLGLTRDGSEARNYNFFDDLDARLADLGERDRHDPTE